LVPGGEQAPWHEVVAATARIVRVAGVPVTADIEAGYGETPDAVMHSVSEIIKAGAAGVNLEDGALRGPAPICSLADAADRVRATREAAKVVGVPIVINARTDLYLRNIGEEASRLDETIERPGVSGRRRRLRLPDHPARSRNDRSAREGARSTDQCQCARRGSPNVAELEALGVARASTASQVALMAISVTRQIADELRATGRFDKLAPTIAQADAQRLFTRL
jgi:2-methylisocitrate lyase-like PEP mutase family enzyme